MSIFDRENEDSVYSRAPDRWQEAMDKIPSYLKTWSFKKIENTFLHRFTTRDRIFKISFWREYEWAVDTNKRMTLTQIARGVCPIDYVYDRIMVNNPLMAWILYPAPSYENSMTEMLDLSTRKLREILELPSINKRNGHIDHKILSLQIKVHELVENRVRGANPQVLNINQRSLNMNVTRSGDDIPTEEELKRLSSDEIQSRITQLEGRIKALPEMAEKKKAVFTRDSKGVRALRTDGDKGDDEYIDVEIEARNNGIAKRVK